MTNASNTGQAITPPPYSPGPPSPQTSRPARRGLNVTLLVSGLVLGVIAIVLLLLGLLAFSSSASAKDDADRYVNERKSLEVKERETQGDTETILAQGRKVGDEVGTLNGVAQQVTDKDNALSAVLQQATDQFNAGNETAANNAVSNQAQPILNDEQNLVNQENQSLTAAQQAKDKLRQGL